MLVQFVPIFSVLFYPYTVFSDCFFEFRRFKDIFLFSFVQSFAADFTRSCKKKYIALFFPILVYRLNFIVVLSGIATLLYLTSDEKEEVHTSIPI